MKLLLVYPPFCTPASPPYSLVNLYTFLKANSDLDVEILDLNLKFHQMKFSKYQKYFQNFSLNDYEDVAKEYLQTTAQTYAENNSKVIASEDPELVTEMVQEITKINPDQVAFSVVYSSQSFYTLTLLKKLSGKIKTIIGGPAVNEKVAAFADYHLHDEMEFLEHLTGQKIDCQLLNSNAPLDFAVPLKDYFVLEPVIPLKTTNTCYYQQCTFCTHHNNQRYLEFPLKQIEKTIIKSKQKQFFFIDDMISKKRLLQLAVILKPLQVKWMCQLKPKDFDTETLSLLYDSGLRIVIWGVESGSNRILKLMKKGTNVDEVAEVLDNSKKVGIKNVLYIMFGFPTETEEEFLETIKFLDDNQRNIDLISTSIFGLQKGTPIYNHPKEFRIKEIGERRRTVLDPKIDFQVSEGLTQAEVIKLKKKYLKFMLKINKYPKSMNFFREHLLNVC